MTPDDTPAQTADPNASLIGAPHPWEDRWSAVMEALPPNTELQLRALGGEQERDIQLELRRTLGEMKPEVISAAAASFRAAAEAAEQAQSTVGQDQAQQQVGQQQVGQQQVCQQQVCQQQVGQQQVCQQQVGQQQVGQQQVGQQQVGQQNLRNTLLLREALDYLGPELYGGAFHEFMASQSGCRYYPQAPGGNTLHPGAALALLLDIHGIERVEGLLSVTARQFAGVLGAGLAGLNIKGWTDTGVADRSQPRLLKLSPQVLVQLGIDAEALQDLDNEALSCSLEAAAPWNNAEAQDLLGETSEQLRLQRHTLRAGGLHTQVLSWQLSPFDPVFLGATGDPSELIEQSEADTLASLNEAALQERGGVYLFSSSMDAHSLRLHLLSALWSQVREQLGCPPAPEWRARAWLLSRAGASDPSWQRLLEAVSATGPQAQTPESATPSPTPSATPSEGEAR